MKRDISDKYRQEEYPGELFAQHGVNSPSFKRVISINISTGILKNLGHSSSNVGLLA